MTEIPVHPLYANMPRINALVPATTKVASPKSEKGYETTLAKLGLHVLQSRVSELMPHFKGFQLLKVSEDGELAAGFFVFQMGKLVVDAPMFLNKGRLKGKELLFFRGRNSFLPSSEALIKYILGVQEQSVGRPAEREGEMRPGRASPNVDIFRQSNQFLSKTSYAPGLSAWAREAGVSESHQSVYNDQRTLDVFNGIKEGRLPSPDLKGLLAIGGFGEEMARYCDSSPAFKKTAAAWDPNWMASVVSARKTAAAPVAEPVAKVQPLVGDRRLIRGSKTASFSKVSVSPNLPEFMEDAERDQNVQDYCEFGVHVTDRRSEMETKKAFAIEVDKGIVTDKTMTTPMVSGCYEVPLMTGDLEKACVVLSQDRVTGLEPAHASSSLVLTKDGQAASVCTNQLLTKISEGNTSDPVTEKENFIDALPTFDVSDVKSGEAFVVFDSLGRSSGIFSAQSNADETGVDVWEQSLGLIGRDVGPGSRHINRGPNSRRYINRIQSVVKGSSLSTLATESESAILLVPEGSKVLKLKKVESDTDSNSGQPVAVGSSDLQLLNVLPSSAMTEMQFAKLAAFRVSDEGGPIRIDGEVMTVDEAVRHLVEDRCYSKQAAFDVVRDAPLNRRYVSIPSAAKDLSTWQLATEVGQKLALYMPPNSPGYSFDEEPPVQGEADASIPVREQYDQETSETSSREYRDKTEIYGERGEKSYSQPQVSGGGAGGGRPDEALLGGGQSEQLLWENQLFESLVRTTRLDTQIAEQLSGLYKLADTVGRTLFLLYAHPDLFEERFGDKDVTLIEEQMISLFEASGELIVDLLQRNVDASNDAMLMNSEDM